MLFVIHGQDRPGDGAALRHRVRAAHLRFVLANAGVFRYGGPLLAKELAREELAALTDG